MSIESPSEQNFNMRNFCTSTKYVHLRCDDPNHESHGNQGHRYQIKHLVRELREVLCEACTEQRRKTIIAKALDRYDQVKRNQDQLTMWTVGTSLDDTEENKEIIIGYWKKFGSRLRTYSKRHNWSFQPLMNALESGTSGGKLHYHFVVRSFMDHEYIKNIWRDITGEESNVNFSRRTTNRKAYKVFSYLAKYIAKDGLRYYFMGKMLTEAKATPYIPSEQCNKTYDWQGEYFRWTDHWLNNGKLIDFDIP